MMNEIFIGFNVFYILLGFVVIVGVILGLDKEGKFRNLRDLNHRKINLDDLTVIVPFRNEQHRIENLLTSFNESSKLPFQIIFVDDYSDDETSEVIKNQLKCDNYTILYSKQEGKKHAISLGIENSTTNYVLTFDSDIKFNSLYFSTLEELNIVDLIILPVKMVGEKWRKIFEIDVDLVNTLNCCIAGYGKPILASGANLFFSKNAYLNFNSLLKHQHLKSGDDVFLLNDFKNHDASIQLISDPYLAVLTSTPMTFGEYFQQRLRWIGKTVAIKNRTTTILAIVQFTLNVIFYALIITALSNQNYKSLICLLATKFTTDFLVTKIYFQRIGKQYSVLLISVHQFVSPILSLFLGVSMIFYTPIWKGRKVS